jgi:hypothetical protein
MKIKWNKARAMVVALAVQIGFVTGCQTGVNEQGVFNHPSHVYLSPEWPAVLATGSDREIRTAAIATANADIAAGNPRVANTGGFASWPVGVPEKYFGLVEMFPKVPLPVGCTSPLLREAGIYAEAYNGEILSYLLHKK